MTHVLIIGGGLAGPLVAMALEKAGISSAVYEAYAEGASVGVGAWLTVAVNGLDAMRTLGVAERVCAAGFPSRDITLVSGTGKVLGEVPIGGELPDGTVTHTLKRSDLHGALLAEASARGIPFHYEKRLVSVHEDAVGVTACFDDGTEAHGDLLVGADGLHSRVRTFIDPQAKTPRYTGHGNMGGFTSGSAVRVPSGTYRMVFGKRAFFGYTTTPEGDTWWFANPPKKDPYTREELAGMDTAAWKASLVELFREDVGPMVELIEHSEGELVGMSQFDLPPVRSWHKGRVVIVGDAAHAASPSSGQGASMAAEDAVALAVALRDARDIEDGLARFSACRKPRAEKVIAYGARSSSAKTLGPVGRAVRDFMMPLFLGNLDRGAATKKLAWLYDHHIAWSPA